MNLTYQRAKARADEVYAYRKMLAHKDPKLRASWKTKYEAAKVRRRNFDILLSKQAPTVSNTGVELVAKFEGFRASPYRDSTGVWTQGYGETHGVTFGKPWTETYARTRLRIRLDRDYLPAVLAAGRGRLNQHQVDAMTSFAYNLGPAAVSAQWPVGKALRAGNQKLAADLLLRYNKAGGRVLPGLTTRRHAERALFLK